MRTDLWTVSGTAAMKFLLLQDSGKTGGLISKGYHKVIEFRFYRD